MAPFILAWLVGEGILTYRAVKATGGPPGPGQLLFSSILFVALGIIAEAPSARQPAMLFAWGLDLAAFMNLAEFGTPKNTGNSWPPKPAAAYQIIPNGFPTGPDPVGAHPPAGSEPDNTHPGSSGQGSASGPSGPGVK